MLRFTHLPTNSGVPVFFQKMPAAFHDVALRWIVFVGSADDKTVGEPGLFHWFEHVPFRGTRKYPDGADAIQKLERWSGDIGAHTTNDRTVFDAHVLKKNWLAALRLITDFVGHPLLRTADVKAEREIIHQEITEALSQPGEWMMNDLRHMLLADHPYSHDVAGTCSSLKKMDSSLLRTAHKTHYDRSRCALIVVGNLSTEEVVAAANQSIKQLPDRALTARRQAVSYGPLPKWHPGKTRRQLPFPVSGTFLIFPVPPLPGDSHEKYVWTLLEAMLSCSTSAPLNRIIREEQWLVYHTSFYRLQSPDGGFASFTAHMQKRNIGRVQKAFREVLRSPQLFSRRWFKWVQDHITSSQLMHTKDPHEYAEFAEQSIASTGRVLSEREVLKGLQSVTHQEVLALLKTLHPDNAREVTYVGTK